MHVKHMQITFVFLLSDAWNFFYYITLIIS